MLESLPRQLKEKSKLKNSRSIAIKTKYHHSNKTENNSSKTALRGAVKASIGESNKALLIIVCHSAEDLDRNTHQLFDQLPQHLTLLPNFYITFISHLYHKSSVLSHRNQSSYHSSRTRNPTCRHPRHYTYLNKDDVPLPEQQHHQQYHGGRNKTLRCPGHQA